MSQIVKKLNLKETITEFAESCFFLYNQPNQPLFIPLVFQIPPEKVF